jgi:hypothetical protein
VTFSAEASGRSQLYVAPFRKALVAEQDWIPITDGASWDDKPRFSQTGNLLFFVSDRDGYRCLWAQTLKSDMHPAGEPSVVYHSHRSSRSIGNIFTLELGVGPDFLVFNQGEFTGNLWLLDLKCSSWLGSFLKPSLNDEPVGTFWHGRKLRSESVRSSYN